MAIRDPVAGYIFRVPRGQNILHQIDENRHSEVSSNHCKIPRLQSVITSSATLHIAQNFSSELFIESVAKQLLYFFLLFIQKDCCFFSRVTS